MAYETKRELDKITITIELDQHALGSLVRRSKNQAELKRKAANVLIAQIKERVDLPRHAHITTDEEWTETCPYCGYEPEYCSEREYYGGKVIIWEGMPQCCSKAQFDWAKDNKPQGIDNWDYVMWLWDTAQALHSAEQRKRIRSA